jgi:hypothetical protein
MMHYPSTSYGTISMEVSSWLQIETPKKAAKTSAKDDLVEQFHQLQIMQMM